jgi:hypothetical protein
MEDEATGGHSWGEVNGGGVGGKNPSDHSKAPRYRGRDVVRELE